VSIYVHKMPHGIVNSGSAVS